MGKISGKVPGAVFCSYINAAKTTNVSLCIFRSCSIIGAKQSAHFLAPAPYGFCITQLQAHNKKVQKVLHISDICVGAAQLRIFTYVSYYFLKGLVG
uniref:Uncharacterized protein n=1 Tax=Pyxicephalus adspersus TaxID=30357 RepID=A0AAV3B4I7_PYXAD|nr:TPA: hypothetical protein GDO54_000060 [Pyxicephalus adspersus]